MRRWMQNQEWTVRIYVILMFLFGAIMSLMVPPWQTPDEEIHVAVMGEGILRPELKELLFQDMELDCYRIKFQADEKVNIEQWKAAITSKPSYSWRECMPRGVHFSVVKHLPALLGLLLGVLLHLPTFWVLELAELFSLVFYVSICWQAMRLMPVKKEVFMLIMAFPMSMQQASSISYDAVLLPLCFLFVAYMMFLRFQKEQLGWRETFFTLLLLLSITYIKLPYLFLGLLVFLLPKEKIQLKIGKYEINGELIRRFRIPAVIVLLLIVGATLYAVRDNFWVQLVYGMTMEWNRTIHLFLATAQTLWEFLMVSSVGQFGWLESQLPVWFVRVTYLLLLVMAVWGKGDQSVYTLTGRTKVFLWGIFVLLSGMIALSMVNHMIMVTLYGTESVARDYNLREALYRISYIGGIQGRYFIPFLVLPFLGLPQKGREIKWKLWVPHVYLLIAMVLSIRVLYFRYWM